MLTKEQKKDLAKFYRELIKRLEKTLPDLDANNKVISPPTDTRYEKERKCIDPNLGINRDWRGWLAEIEADPDGKIESDDFIACRIMNFKCDLIRNHPDYAGDGQDCPEYITHFCWGFLEDNPQWRSVSQRRCLKRIVQNIVKKGVYAKPLRPVRIECPKICPVHELCVSDTIPENLVLERDPESPTYNPRLYRLPKTLFDQFMICIHLRTVGLVNETIAELEAMIEMCEK